MARTTWALRIEGKTSKACWAPGSSAYTTGRRETSRSRATKSRACSTLTRVSCTPCSTKKSGASSVIRSSGVAASNCVGRLAPAALQDPRGEEQVAHQLGAALPGAAGEVVDAVVRHRDLHRGVGVLEAGLPGRVAGGERGERGEVAARRAAGDRDGTTGPRRTPRCGRGSRRWPA